MAAQVAGNQLATLMRDTLGRPMANGVYFYVATVRGYDGKVITSEIRKIVLLR
jgi:hypothetical protein